MGLCRGMVQCKGTEGAGVRAGTRLYSKPVSGQVLGCAQSLQVKAGTGTGPESGLGQRQTGV